MQRAHGIRILGLEGRLRLSNVHSSKTRSADSVRMFQYWARLRARFPTLPGAPLIEIQSSSPPHCFACKAQDHLIRDCPHWRPSPNASQGANAAASTAPAIKDIGSSVGSGQTAKEGGPLAHPSQSVGGRSFGAVVQESPRSTRGPILQPVRNPVPGEFVESSSE